MGSRALTSKRCDVEIEKPRQSRCDKGSARMTLLYVFRLTGALFKSSRALSLPKADAKPSAVFLNEPDAHPFLAHLPRALRSHLIPGGSRIDPQHAYQT